MAILKVWIEEDCISCGQCESTCPEVFKLKEKSTIKEGVNFSDYETQIKEAADNCPMQVIKFSE